ncbi:MAG TPA: XRE family transcriptional regulator [Thermoanaerobaculia bacterium]
MDVIDRLNAAVKASGKARKQIALDAGMSTSKLSRLLRREIRARIDDVEAILGALNLTMESLYGGGINVDVDIRLALKTLADYVDRHEPRASPKGRASRVVRPFPVAATPNVVLFDAREKARIHVPEELWQRGARYGARVIGDSMIDAGIDDGDIVFFRPMKTKHPPRGAIVIIRVNDGVYLKRYEEARGEKRLLSENEAYRPRVLKPEDEVELYGVVVQPVHKP